MRRAVLFCYVWVFLVCSGLFLFVSGCGSAGSGLGMLNASGTAGSTAQVSPLLPPAPPPVPVRAENAAPHQSRDSQAYPLYMGWNTVSFPNNSVTAITGMQYKLCKFNGTGYDFIDPNLQPGQIDTYYGYWNYSDTATQYAVEGPYDGTHNAVLLHAGWNLFACTKRSQISFSSMGITYNGVQKTLGAATGFNDQNDGSAWAYARLYEYRNNQWSQLNAKEGSNLCQPGYGYWIWSWVEGATLDFYLQLPPPDLPPSVDVLYPASGPAATVVTVYGNHLGATQGSSTVTLRGLPVTDIQSWSDTRLVLSIPDGAATGPLVAQVNGQFSNTTVSFTVTSLPHIDSLTPITGGVGVPVTIQGSNFGPSGAGNSVSFNGMDAGACPFWNNNKIICNVPGVGGGGRVEVVVTVNSEASNAAYFWIGVSSYYVSPNGKDSDPGTINQPFYTVSHALEVARSGDTIFVAQYDYTSEHGNTFPIHMKNGVRLIGGYDASFTHYDPALFQTVLNPDTNGRVVESVNNGSTTEIRGFWITEGNVGYYTHGAGVYFYNSNALMAECWITGNYTGNNPSNGAGIFVDQSSPTITYCTISDNHADGGSGGGLASNLSSPVITHCVFESNTAIDIGGAMYLQQSGGEIAYCSFSMNSNSGTDNGEGGGAIAMVTASTPHISFCDFSQNLSAVEGGALLVSGASVPVIEDSTFENNKAPQAGAVECQDSSPAVFNRCTFTSNQALSSSGGAVVLCNESAAQFTGCTFNSNNALSGGAIYAVDTAALINRCVFTDNSAAVTGGALEFLDANPRIYSNVFAGNLASGDPGGGAVFINASVRAVYPSIYNCLFNGNQSTSHGGAVSCLMSGNMMYMDMRNCTFYNNLANGNGGALRQTSAIAVQIPVTFLNNIFYGNNSNGAAGAMCLETAHWLPVTASYNDFNNNLPFDAAYNGTGGGPDQFPGWGWNAVNNITANPGFINPAGGDFHFPPGPGVCVDTGDPAYAGITLCNLLDGTWRTQLSNPDMNVVDMGYHYPIP